MSIGIGDKVRLRIAAYGKPGVVVAEAHGKCRVRWHQAVLTLYQSIYRCEKQ